MNNSTNNFNEYELGLLSKLPLDIVALAGKYRTDILNAAEFCDEPPFENGYVPELIEIYYGDAESSHVFVKDGILQEYNLIDLDSNSKSISVQIDSQWAYIEIEGQVILDRLGGVKLPEVIVNPAALTKSALQVQE
ncbi:hypothetical protein [Anabaena azotica]|uniref:Uncharacterized protein n=1 Tax=Anabaena azotica FACHB-119 TaxID=947527 RepID=A0ABR8DB94_9NOST|nr:hypothetical protein [Anabaena azotica]MBD2503899.1 hypothetical protein [Anabaena azotica FACHB-119]